MFTTNINSSSQHELLSCRCYYYVSPNMNKLWLLLCYLRIPPQLASPPGFDFNTHPEGKPCIYMCIWYRYYGGSVDNIQFGEIDKIGYTRVVSEQNQVPFTHDGARLRTSAKRLQNAFWRLNPLRFVCAQHPKPFFRCAAPQNSANDGARKVLSTNNPILFRNTPGIPCPVLRFINHPILFIPHNGRSFTQQ